MCFLGVVVFLLINTECLENKCSSKIILLQLLNLNQETRHALHGDMTSITTLVVCVEIQSMILWCVRKISQLCPSWPVTACRTTTCYLLECPYLCTDAFYTTSFDQTNTSDLCNRDIQQNRQGQMCGKCLDNLHLLPTLIPLSVLSALTTSTTGSNTS